MGLWKKTQSLFFGELRERLRDSVLRQAVMIEQIMVNNHVTVFVKNNMPLFVHPHKFLAGIILARLLHGGKENRIVLFLGAEFVVPFLDEQNGSLGSGVRLEHVAMQTYHGKNPATLGDKIADVFVAGIIEASLREFFR